MLPRCFVLEKTKIEGTNASDLKDESQRVDKLEILTSSTETAVLSNTTVRRAISLLHFLASAPNSYLVKVIMCCVSSRHAFIARFRSCLASMYLE